MTFDNYDYWLAALYVPFGALLVSITGLAVVRFALRFVLAMMRSA